MTALPAGSSAFTLAVVFELLLLPVELLSLSVPDAVPVADPLASPVAVADSESPDEVMPAVFRLPAFAGSSDADAVAVGAGEDAVRVAHGQSLICTRDVARCRAMGVRHTGRLRVLPHNQRIKLWQPFWPGICRGYGCEREEGGGEVCGLHVVGGCCWLK